MPALPPPPDPDDPAHILAVLPDRWHDEFLAEYRGALNDAREVRHWAQLRTVLHRWRMRAAAYSDPGFDSAAQEALHVRPEELHPAPGWDQRQ